MLFLKLLQIPPGLDGPKPSYNQGPSTLNQVDQTLLVPPQIFAF